MAFSPRLLQLFLRRNVSSARNYATSGPANEHEASMVMWRKLTYFVAFPSILVCTFKVYLDEKEHANHPHRPEFVPYEYLRVINKKYPWGDGNHTLMFNPKVNALRDGYEDEGKEEHH